MRHLISLLGILVLFALGTSAQVTPANGVLLTPSSETSVTAAATVNPAPAFNFSNVSLAPVPAAAEPAAPQNVVGVFEENPWQISGGYTFFRFYEVPSITLSMNGFYLSGAYYFKNWFAAEGDLMATFASQSGFGAHYVFASGGPRFRWSGPRGLELWGHALVGHSHFVPQTPFGDQGAFTYEAGGGLDINIHQRRLAYRAEADMVGSHFFHTYQYSPRVSIGVVFKF